MKLSIIIPVYEPQPQDITRCLDSIYSQKVSEKEYEVICVDDCSPSSYVKEIITGYNYEGSSPSNLIYIRHSRNTRQGGARNTAIKNAKGEYFTCIDQDDFYNMRSIENMLSAQHYGTDMIMFDHALSDDNCRIKITSQYEDKDSAILHGHEFLLTHAVSWMPWGYMYRTAYVRQHGFKFEEHVRFEDVDFVLNCVANAQTIKYVAQSNVVHRETDIQTSAVGNNREKNIDLVKIAYRVGVLAQQLKAKGNPAWRKVMDHHTFMYESALKRNVWRLNRKDIKEVLSSYPPQCTEKMSIRIFTSNTTLFALFACAAKPFLLCAWKIKKYFI